ncbi:MAG: hypothetical protein ABL958_19390 [Bdellovibrionia bacterium]
MLHKLLPMKWLVLFGVLISAPVSAQTVSLDAHFHVDRSWIFPVLFAKIDDIEREIQKSVAARQLLISKAYIPAYWNREPDVVAYATRTNSEVNDVVARSEGRGIGVCGMDIEFPNADKILAECLALPHMKGVKFHFRAGKQSFRNPLHNRAFVRLGEIIQTRKAFVLIHLDVDENSGEEIRCLSRERLRQESV